MPRIIAPAAPGTQTTPLNAFSPVGSISTWGPESGSYGATPAGGDSNLNSINLGLNVIHFMPFTLNEAVTITGLGWDNSTGPSGNIDAGVYDLQGNRLVSTGSTAQAGVSAVQTVAVALTLIGAGNYFLALVQDNASGSLRGISMGQAVQEILGCKQQVTFPLPALATFVKPATLGYPNLSAFTQTVF